MTLDYDKIIEDMAEAIEKKYVSNELRFNQYELAKAAFAAMQDNLPKIPEFTFYFNGTKHAGTDTPLLEKLYNELRTLGK